ncbi:hypothetical protein [Actinomadura sp. B10D3]|uniref:hypothetical protein n=1 Tax=Actinomadura sp. B10D3 TaxID=3153557 RepID=UPI00325F144B
MLIDFGLATSTGDEFSRITQTCRVPGTARYMAPELLCGEEASRPATCTPSAAPPPWPTCGGRAGPA